MEEYEIERARLEGEGLQVDTAEHRWVQARSLFFRDPENNVVEFVCFDPTLPKEEWGPA